MKGWGLILALLALLLAAPLGAAAQDNLSVRLVEGVRNQGASLDPALADVKDLLTRNLAPMALKLIDKKAVKLPASQAYDFDGGVTLTLRGKADSLSVKMQRGTDVVNSTVTLQPGKPFLLVGFPTGTGQLILILQVY